MAINDTIPKDNYPFATKDGKVIPLDIIKPTGVIIKTFNSDNPLAITIPEGILVAVLSATEACVVQLTTSVIPSDGVFIEDALYLPANTLVTTTLKAGSINVIGVQRSGRLAIQAIEKWAGLSLDINYTKR